MEKMEEFPVVASITIEKTEAAEEIKAPYEDFREFTTQIRCVVCQKTNGENLEGQPVEPLDYVPEIVRISDPQHVKTVGSGGVDAENIVPLCHYHHVECHNIGILTFQEKYNIDLKLIAIDVYQAFFNTVQEVHNADYAKALHERILSRVYFLKRQALEVGKMLFHLQTAHYEGRPLYNLLGFDRFKDYVEAPIDAGGLDIRYQSMYRWIKLYEVALEVPNARIDALGAHKAEALLPLIRETDDEAEKDFIIEKAKNISVADTISMVHERRGTKDPREVRINKVATILEDYSKFFEVDPNLVIDIKDETDRFARLIYSALRGRS